MRKAAPAFVMLATVLVGWGAVAARRASPARSAGNGVPVGQRADPAVLSRWSPRPHSPLARHEHPRIWMTLDILPLLRAKLASAEYRDDYQAFVAQLDGRPSRRKNKKSSQNAQRKTYNAERSTQDVKRADAVETSAAGADAQAVARVVAYAFVYRVGEVPGISYARPIVAYGTEAKSLLLAAVNTNTRRRWPMWPSVAYDWLFDLLTPPERQSVVALIQSLHSEAPRMKDPWDDRSTALVQERILAGLAFWGDGIADAFAQELVDLYRTEFTAGGALTAANLIAGDDGGSSEGFGYSAKGGGRSTLMNLIKVQEAWRTANGLKRADAFGGSHATALRYYPQWIAYLIRPHATPNSKRSGGYEFMAYKTHVMEAMTPIAAKPTLQHILSSFGVYKDLDPAMAALAGWLLRERVGTVDARRTDPHDVMLSGFLFGEKDITPRSPSELRLPLSKHFEGLGWVAMRTGWDRLEDTMVTFIASPWWRSFYTNRNQNSFTIDRRGPLALNSGHATHHDYANSTWAHNTIIFPGAASRGDQVDDQGGQRRSYKPRVTSAAQLTVGSIYDLGGVKRFQPADSAKNFDVDYVFGDATRAYNGPANKDEKNEATVKLFTRQMVYFRPETPRGADRIVVFDRTETVSPRVEKRWLLHPAGHPQVDGRERQEREGRWTYDGGDLVTATNTAAGSFGRLFSRTLLPRNPRIVKIGGPGHEFEDPAGRNMPARGFDPADEREAQYVGTYRIEVIPSVASASDLFLHVLEAVDADVPAPTPATLLEGEQVVGARVGNRVAVFSRTEAVLRSAEVILDSDGPARVLFCDLQPGATYDVHGGSSATVIASPAGLAYIPVEARAGTRLGLRIR